MHETDSKETSVDKAVVSKVIVWKCDHTLRSVQSIQLSLSSLRLCILYTVQRTFSFRCRHNTLTKAMTFRFLVRIVYYLWCFSLFGHLTMKIQTYKSHRRFFPFIGLFIFFPFYFCWHWIPNADYWNRLSDLTQPISIGSKAHNSFACSDTLNLAPSLFNSVYCHKCELDGMRKLFASLYI